VLLQDVDDGPAAEVVIQVREPSLNPRVAPRAIFGRHPDDPLADLRSDLGPSRAAPLMTVILASDQRPMPGEQGVGCHDGPDLCQHAPTERLGFRGETDALIVGEPEPLGSDLLA
jgi:hypothetical protein